VAQGVGPEFKPQYCKKKKRKKEKKSRIKMDCAYCYLWVPGRSSEETLLRKTAPLPRQ
jgi:hypothetical protein